MSNRQLLVVCGIVFAATVVGVFVWGRFGSSQHTSQIIQNQVSPQPSPTLDPLRPFAIALMGYGGPGHQGGNLTDTILVARIAPRQQTIHLISVPRDIWVELPTGPNSSKQGWKLNAAFAIGGDDDGYPHKPVEFTGEQGGIAMAKYALQEVTGLPIKNSIAVNFIGFTQAIDTLGGITVDVDQSFDDFWYPVAGKEADPCGFSPEDITAMTATLSGQKLEEQFPCRYQHLHFEAGRQTMDGATALTFVRSRHAAQDGNDFGRSARQRKVVLAVRDKVFQINFLPKAIPFLSQIRRNIQTDLSLDDWQQYLAQANEYRNYTVISTALTDKSTLKASRSANGQFILIPQTSTTSTGIDWTSVHTWLEQELASTSTAAAQLEK